jgi:hypothetical protein
MVIGAFTPGTMRPAAIGSQGVLRGGVDAATLAKAAHALSSDSNDK